ncbi:uncharacterized protein LOC141606698 [Silene latifolia]|uniref:uncharacterized protein LOC141606698 n=1 Tax=Silene latifolia TaxID=37657 RepID=UPI003D78826F
MPSVRRNSCEKIMGFGENVAKMRKGTVDRISELPDFILHLILSMLDTKEAGRASVLSKRWYDVWSSIPVLDFRFQYFKGDWDRSKYDFNVYYDTGTLQSFLGFIDRTMRRYFTERYRIMKISLELPMVDGKIEPLVDQWFKIVVQSQIEELEFKILYERPPEYRLPEILFRAKSLKVLNCENVLLPYYETMELISLEYLTLTLEIVNLDLLQRIISLCPLVELDITISYLEKLSLPWTRKVNEAAEFVGNEIVQSNFKASPLRKLAYNGMGGSIPWPWNMNVFALKNLRNLEFVRARITDDIVSQLARGLVVLERLVLSECPDLNCIDISSISLKILQIIEGLDVMKVTVDTPNLLEFFYNCEVKTALSLTSALDHCNAQFAPLVVDGEDTITTDWLVELKKILFETNFFKSLVIDLSTSLEIDVEEEELRNLATGPSYKLRELKLREASPDPTDSSLEAFLRETRYWKTTESSLPAFLDGLFWCCRPDVLSITTNLYNLTAKSILNILKRKVRCYKHPLRSIEVEGVDSSSFLSEPSEFEIRFRLSWF